MIKGFLCGSAIKNQSANTKYLGLIPELGQFPGGKYGNTLQRSCMERSLDRGTWWATVIGVAKELDMTDRLNNNELKKVWGWDGSICIYKRAK